MEWIKTTFYWYLMLFLLGLLFFPATKKIFKKYFYDYGYAFSKTIAILALSYTAFLLGLLKLVPFTQDGLFFIIIIFISLNLFLIYQQKKSADKKPSTLTKGWFFIIIFEELVFLASLFFWAKVRGQEPSIRGLEKFMDFGFINSILRSSYFPPADIWFSGGNLNYYYFGHLTGAVLTKLSGIASNITYNLILASIFALGITQIFSLCFNLILTALKTKNNLIKQSLKKIFIYAFLGGIIGAFLVNFGGNLHAIYIFTKGYPNDKPLPFWQIFGAFTPEKYWYPNATRFIPFTIHEFPLYSYVVADLHGHVFDIPFVLLTLAVLFIFYLRIKQNKLISTDLPAKAFLTLKDSAKKVKEAGFNRLTLQFGGLALRIPTLSEEGGFQLILTIFLGFLTAVHYMTNAFDGPIYLLLSFFIFFVLFGLSRVFFINVLILIFSFFLFSLPLSVNFKPFVSGIGVNCSLDFLTRLKKFGPFLFEAGKCQNSPLWMILVLWGFFWLNFAFFAFILLKNKKPIHQLTNRSVNDFIFILFSFSTVLIIVPEFFYIKDIYPDHFRANTMFKLGYQAFMMMGIASVYVFILIKKLIKQKNFSYKTKLLVLYLIIFCLEFSLVAIYPYFAINSYYGKLKKTPNLNGSLWINDKYGEYQEIIDYLNKNVYGQPTILEAQGDSYTDYNVVSAYTGLPTVAGWWVHEWLWRGSSDVVGKRIPDIQTVYEDENLEKTLDVIKKYQISYVVIGSNEKTKYKNLKENKFNKISRLIFSSSNEQGKIYKINENLL